MHEEKLGRMLITTNIIWLRQYEIVSELILVPSVEVMSLLHHFAALALKSPFTKMNNVFLAK